MSLFNDINVEEVFELIESRILTKSDSPISIAKKLVEKKNEVLLNFINKLLEKFKLESYPEKELDITIKTKHEDESVSVSLYYRNETHYGFTGIIFDLKGCYNLRQLLSLRNEVNDFKLPRGQIKL